MPRQLDDICEDWQDLDEADRLAELVEMADDLKELSPTHGAAPFPAACRVQECQTAVHLWVSVRDGRVSLEADVPRSSPTVRGLVALVQKVVDGATVDDVLSLPNDWLPLLGLQSALGMTRQRGLAGVIGQIKRDVLRQTG
jgi:cysteine desulfuration protein SufE